MIANQPIKLAETSTRQVAKLATGHLVAGPVELLFISSNFWEVALHWLSSHDGANVPNFRTGVNIPL